MEKKKILVLCYLKKNLGDDLFLSLLLSRFPNEIFETREFDPQFIKHFIKYSNYRNVSENKKLFGYDLTIYKACIYIGGSLFQEKGNSLKNQEELNRFIELCKNSNIPFFYIGSNFGPYHSKEFLDECTKTFKLVEGITFRDKYSYNKFKAYKSVSYAPDLIFGLSIRKSKKIKDSIGISIIDLSLPYRGKELNDIEENYIIMLKDDIVRYINDGKKIYLFSFCEHEGDLKAANKLISLLPSDYQPMITLKKYNGKNMYDYLRFYSKMEKVLCTRFHSLILSLLFEQELVVISYNEKLTNFLKDITSSFKEIKLKKEMKNTVISYNDFSKIDKKELKHLKLNACKQFKQFEHFLQVKNNNSHLRIIKPSFKERVKRRVKKIK